MRKDTADSIDLTWTGLLVRETGSLRLIVTLEQTLWVLCYAAESRRTVRVVRSYHRCSLTVAGASLLPLKKRATRRKALSTTEDDTVDSVLAPSSRAPAARARRAVSRVDLPRGCTAK